MTDQLPASELPKYTHFSFALVPEQQSPSPGEIAVVSGSVLTGSAIDCIKAAVREWLLTEAGIEALEECDGSFTILDLNEWYYPPIEDLLFKHGIIDLQIDIENVYSEHLFLDQDLNSQA
jgi:hypothetical protein